MRGKNKYNIETVVFEYNKKDKDFEMFFNSVFRDYINDDKIVPDTIKHDDLEKENLFKHSA
ncbi:MAG: hypothetical protein E7477_09245 [Ruminococcaceae bacterium]|nr:hypothetical protein [Oscillospiraceae bacterium]